MPSQHHTIILVPHARARLRKWRVSNLQIALALGFLLLLTGAGLFISWAYFGTTLDTAELERLRNENQDLRQTNLTFEESIRRLETQLASYEERTRQLAIVAGLENLSEGFEAGIGGDPFAIDPDTGGYDLISLESRAGSLAGRLDQVAENLEERFRWISSTPAIAPTRGLLASGFGYRRDPIHGGRAFHQGIDIAAAPGHPVRATGDGIVVRAGRIGGLGKAVYVSHGYGISSRYGHLSKIEVTPGQKVQRGDIVGRVGNTGRSTGYHLHYEVHVDGKAVDPRAYILDQPGR